MGVLILSDKKTKFLLSQDWITLEDACHLLEQDTYKVLQICLLKNESILYIKPKHLQLKENKSHRGFFQTFSKSYKIADKLDYEAFYRIGKDSSLELEIDSILGLETNILQIKALYDIKKQQDFIIRILDYTGGEKEYGIAFGNPYIDLDECKTKICFKVSDFIEHFKDILDLEPTNKQCDITREKVSINKVRLLLSKEYISVEEVKEVLSSNDINLKANNIIDWGEQKGELYIKPKDWVGSMTTSDFEMLNKNHEEKNLGLTLTSDFVKLTEYAIEISSNSSDILIVINAIEIDTIEYFAIFAQEKDEEKETLYTLERNIASKDALASMFFMKSVFIRNFLDKSDSNSNVSFKKENYQEECYILQPYIDLVNKFISENKERKDVFNTRTDIQMTLQFFNYNEVIMLNSEAVKKIKKKGSEYNLAVSSIIYNVYNKNENPNNKVFNNFTFYKSIINGFALSDTYLKDGKILKRKVVEHIKCQYNLNKSESYFFADMIIESIQ